MQPGYIMGALWRRKLLTALGLVVTICLAVGAAVATGPSYESEAIVVLIPPTPDQGVKNPYLYLAGLNQARDIVERSLGSEEVQAELKKRDATAQYTVTEDPMSAGPLLVITADAATKDQVNKTLTALLDNVAPSAKRLQDRLNIAPSAQIKTLEITRDEEPKVVRKSQMRTAIMAGALGLGLSLLAVALVDGLLTRRRRDEDSAGSTGDQPEQPHNDEVSGPGQPERQNRPERPARPAAGPRRPAPTGRPAPAEPESPVAPPQPVARPAKTAGPPRPAAGQRPAVHTTSPARPKPALDLHVNGVRGEVRK